ncbi:neurofilament heavy polypeptide-like isoform X2 [Dreissena polymorpha]|uniref:neurofilament heavy polypeptide-like isoform X2 n=1 Tax=Dreissena polymorpha TaxID=45954 RepID=UPI0022642C95|nr:neurofilament heavy polypeptide-like isoform X2 [Dreissena polymorpha]
MSDLLHFGDEDDNLFKPEESRPTKDNYLFKPEESRPTKSFEDIFGDTGEDNTLDDVLMAPIQDDIFKTSDIKQAETMVSKASSKQSATQKTVDSLFGSDIDDEPDLMFPKGDKKPASVKDDDFDFLFSTAQVNKSDKKSFKDDLDDFFGSAVTAQSSKASLKADAGMDLFDMGESVNTDEGASTEMCHLLASDIHPVFLVDPHDSLDAVLKMQPEGTVPASDDLFSLANSAANNNTCALHDEYNKEQSTEGETNEEVTVDDIYTKSESEPCNESPELDEEEPVAETTNTDKTDDVDNLDVKPEETVDTKEELEEEKHYTEPTKKNKAKKSLPKTNLKKSMERSFEDLLTGLSDESEPELDDLIIPGAMESSNLESILWSPTTSKAFDDTSVRATVLDNSDAMYAISSTPNVEVKVTAPEISIEPADTEDFFEFVDKEEIEGQEEGDISGVEMRHKPQAGEFDLPDMQDANHLDVDVTKHKSALGKQGSLALRRKLSRKSRRSLLSTGEDALFQDSTEPKQNADSEGEETVEPEANDSPPAKKPSPSMMVPLPGIAAKPPQRLTPSATDGLEASTETKEVKRLSRPPPGAFILPSPAQVDKPLRSPTKPPTSTKQVTENKSAVFEKPALRSVKPVTDQRSPEPMETGTFSTPTLKSVELQEGEKRGRSESSERDLSFQPPVLRSRTCETPEEDKPSPSNTGVFIKPALRSTPKPERKSSESEQSEKPDFDVPLKKASKPDLKQRHESPKHMFETPKLKSTGRKITPADEHDNDNTNTSAIPNNDHAFDKPVLRQTKTRNDSAGESGFTFEKPPLKSAVSPGNAREKPDNSSGGMFEKPALKRATPSPEKEVKPATEPKGIFDRPVLRKTGSVSQAEKDKQEQEKPSWLQQAAEKQSKVLDVLQSKENHHTSEKSLPSWLEKPALKKTGGSPLQDSSNTQSSQNGDEDMNKLSKNVKIRKQSSGSENEPRESRSGSVTKPHDNYTPSWLRQGRSPSVPASGVMSPPQNIPTQSNEMPQWKIELQQRRASRKEKTPEDTSMQSDESSEPEWKRGLALRKTSRSTAATSKDNHSVEPEWKKAAEEKRARLRSKSTLYTHLSFK